MSREITYVANLAVTVGGTTDELKSLVAYANMSGSKIVKSVAALTTTVKALDVAEITSCGVAAFKNLDTSDTIVIQNGLTGDDIMELLPGETWVCRLRTNTPAAKTLTGTASLAYLICEE